MSLRPFARVLGALAVTVAVGVSAGACASIPVDPEGTLVRASGGVLRVGMSHQPPWTSLEDGERAGVEVRLVEDFAAGIDAEVEWLDGGEEALMRALDLGRLDVVVGGLTEQSPWADQAALTRPYVVVTAPDGAPEAHVMAARYGENALLVALERHLHEHEAEVAEELGGQRP
jgi:polar amino acid transport system substrate-binding protein